MQATLVLLLTPKLIMLEHTLALDHSWGWAGYNSTGIETKLRLSSLAHGMTHSRCIVALLKPRPPCARWLAGGEFFKKTRFFMAKCKSLSTGSTKDTYVMIALSNGASHIHP